MTEKQKDLCFYRMAQAEETIQSAHLCMENHLFKDAINRSYYAAFYAVKAVLALADTDFKRHKDVVAYFNKEYVAQGIFSRETGRLLARLQKKREASDYDDFYIASHDEAAEQINAAGDILKEIKVYLHKSTYGGNTMKSRRVPLTAEVVKYETGKGMEDGVELWSDVVTKGWIVTDFLVKIKREDGSIVCPYILNRRGRVFIGEGDYMVVDEDGTKHVCGADKIWERYERAEDGE